jgi:hypothetical protein
LPIAAAKPVTAAIASGDALERAGLDKEGTFYLLRHSYISRAIFGAAHHFDKRHFWHRIEKMHAQKVFWTLQGFCQGANSQG